MVGTRCIYITDETRNEVLGKKDGKRKIVVRFYYPGVEDSNAKPCEYLSKGKLGGFGRKPDFTLYKERISFYENLEFAQGSFPLILFSHGYGGYVEQNSDLCCYLAENGYIVASIGHQYEASETVFADGSGNRFDNSLYLKMFKPFIPSVIDLYKMRKEKLSGKEAMERFDAHQLKYESFMIKRLEEWAKDDRCAIDRIEQMNDDERSFLFKKIDFSKGIGATGHSFGGCLAYYHCLYDDKISCGVNIDGGLFGDYKEDINHKPFMQIYNINNENVVSRARFYHDKPVHYLLFKDMEHNGFTDWKLVNNKPKIVGSADPILALDTLNEANLAFFDRYLKLQDLENDTPLPIHRQEIGHYEVL